jgi:hypothetical protein
MNYNNYTCLVKQGHIIVNAFCIPSRTLATARFHAEFIAQSIYTDLEYELEVKQVH